MHSTALGENDMNIEHIHDTCTYSGNGLEHVPPRATDIPKMSRAELETAAKAWNTRRGTWREFWRRYADDAIEIALRDDIPLGQQLCAIVRGRVH